MFYESCATDFAVAYSHMFDRGVMSRASHCPIMVPTFSTKFTRSLVEAFQLPTFIPAVSIRSFISYGYQECHEKTKEVSQHNLDAHIKLGEEVGRMRTDITKT